MSPTLPNPLTGLTPEKILTWVVGLAALIAVIGLVAGCSATPPPTQAPTGDLTVRVIRELPYAPQTFTEGLEVDGDNLLVSAGMTGRSSLSRRDIETGEVVEEVILDPQYFAEGTTRVGEVIWQMTYKAETAFQYDAETLEQIGEAHYSGEGWGLCSWDDDPATGTLYMSDGTAQLRRLAAADFTEQGRITVTENGQPVTRINELSCAPDGYLYANVFMTDDILQINPETGEVTGRIDASALRPEEAKRDINAVLNGIAHVPGTDHFYLSGKDWTVMYEVQFVR